MEEFITDMEHIILNLSGRNKSDVDGKKVQVFSEENWPM